ERVDLQGVQGGQAFIGGVAPQQLGALAFGQFQVGLCQAVDNFGGDVRPEVLAVAGHDAVAEADEVVADIDGRGGTVLPVPRLAAVAEGVVVLDVVVDQRRLVERLDGQGDALDGVGQADALGGQGAGG